MKLKILFILSFIFLGMTLTACSTTGSMPAATKDIHTIQTEVAGTLIAQRTQEAGQGAVAKLTEIARATPAAPTQVIPTQASQPTVTGTQAPTVTLVPSPTATSIPPTPVPPTPIPATPTARPIPCNWVLFVKDISVPDGSVFIPKTQFTKTWRLKNIGTCNWTREYALVFESGDLMGADKEQWLEETIKPGETVDVSVTFTAPSKEGKHTSYWMLRSQNGSIFGLGDGASKAFWVEIKVADPTSVVYSFADRYCKARWYSKYNTIPCVPADSGKISGGSSSEEEGSLIAELGSVNYTETPRLETGSTDNESTLIVHPNNSSDGFITGEFPEQKIRAGDWFRTVIGCVYDNPNCNVTFKLLYSVDGGAVQTLGTWKQTYDDKIEKINLDLSFLAGKQVVFILTVQNNGSSQGDWGFWLHPRIAR